MIHIDKEGNVIGSFDPPQGHGMAVDAKDSSTSGTPYNGLNTVRKYDPKTGNLLAEVPRAPEAAGRRRGRRRDEAPHIPGHGGPGPVGTFPAGRGGAGGGGRGGANAAAQAAALAVS